MGVFNNNQFLFDMSEIQIIAHRGFWRYEKEKNSMAALERAIEEGYGFETDFRDCRGEILVAHNPPRGDEVTAEDVFKMYSAHHCGYTLALNIKADGLQDMMKVLLGKYDIRNYFCFDMSVCDTLLYSERNLTIATRVSEYEVETPFLNASEFVWLDYFTHDPSEEKIREYLQLGKKVCVVSPELHNLPYENTWNIVRRISGDNMFICTDLPDKAKDYFLK